MSKARGPYRVDPLGYKKAQKALDKMAENARELGLDYEPPCKTGSQCTSKCQQCEQPAQQEPVAWICEGSSSDEKHAIDYWPGDIEDIPIGTKLYTSPPAQRKPLTDEQIEDIWADCPADWDDKINVLTLARAIEAAHGIKENT